MCKKVSDRKSEIWNTDDGMCVFVCACVREREGEIEREKERERVRGSMNVTMEE